MADTDGPEERSLLARCLSEAIGTALLVSIGLSIVIFNEGHASPLANLLPSEAARRALTGLLFGTNGDDHCTLARRAGQWRPHQPHGEFGLLVRKDAPGPNRGSLHHSQMIGAVLGALPLLAWDFMGRSISYGATKPGAGPHGDALAVLGEVITTFFLIILLLSFIGHRRLRRFTPLLFPPLYCIMLWLEAPWSGASTNPARSLGPDVIALDARHYWIYWLGPVLGTLLAFTARRFLPVYAISKLMLPGSRISIGLHIPGAPARSRAPQISISDPMLRVRLGHPQTDQTGVAHRGTIRGMDEPPELQYNGHWLSGPSEWGTSGWPSPLRASS